MRRLPVWLLPMGGVFLSLNGENSLKVTERFFRQKKGFSLFMSNTYKVPQIMMQRRETTGLLLIKKMRYLD
jgi:hypothetical protein